MSLPRNFYAQIHALADSSADYQAEIAAEICESPIEVAFFTAFVMLGQFNYGSCAMVGPKGGEIDASLCQSFEYFVWPQYNWRKYRVDFLVGEYSVRSDRVQIAVECDGHNFHERTKAQAERDRSRDREMQAGGFKVFRFTGREIYRDAFQCATEVYEEILSESSCRDDRKVEK